MGPVERRLAEGGLVDHPRLGWSAAPVGPVLSQTIGLPVSVASHVEAMAAAGVAEGLAPDLATDRGNAAIVHATELERLRAEASEREARERAEAEAKAAAEAAEHLLEDVLDDLAGHRVVIDLEAQLLASQRASLEIALKMQELATRIMLSDD